MHREDFLYGCHSAVQKAVRRGDLNLMKTAFEGMWPEAQHRNWLKWRASILVEEDVWWMLGEAMKFFKSVKKAEDEKLEWRRFLYKLAVCQKNQDTAGLYFTALNWPPDEDEHPELKEMRFWLGVAGDDPAAAAVELFDEMKADGRSEYELAAAGLMKSRMYQGGMVSDKWCCLAAMVLIKCRGLVEEDCLAKMEEGARRHLSKHGSDKPRTIELPWWTLDSHTAIGKFALAVFMKRLGPKFKGMDKDKFDWIWFMMESAQIPDDQVDYVKLTKKIEPTPFQSIWWPELVKDMIRYGEWTPKQVAAIWRKNMREEIKNIVRWCANKREEEARKKAAAKS